MMLCRVALGRVARAERFYNKSEETKMLIDGIIEAKTHHSLLGDREARAGTYREFVVYNQAQIYPEFILLYNRVFPDPVASDF